jgi:hypothetical protein
MGWEMPETIAIWGIEAATADVFTEDLSPCVADAVKQVAAEVIEYLSTPLDRPSPVDPPVKGGWNVRSET